MRCLYCGEVIIPAVSWRSMFSIEEEVLLCEQCIVQLEQIGGDRCIRCSRPFEGLTEEYRKDEYCFDCVRWEEVSEWNGVLDRNRSHYIYNDFLKEVISRYKFRGDYILVRFFCKSLIQVLKEVEYDLLVPIPSSQERLYERGFNQAEALIIEAGLTPTLALKRTHTEKQSKKSREDRIHLANIFNMVTEEDIVGKKVILVDDIYTTGSTLMHAGKLLKQYGALSVSSFTMARG